MATICIVVRPKDAAVMLGLNYYQAVRKHKKIREHYGKTGDQYLSAGEFAAYTGLPVAEVMKALQ